MSYPTALGILDTHGLDGAYAYIVRQLKPLIDAGDWDGVERWRRVAAAIDEVSGAALAS